MSIYGVDGGGVVGASFKTLKKVIIVNVSEFQGCGGDHQIAQVTVCRLVLSQLKEISCRHFERFEFFSLKL